MLQYPDYLFPFVKICLQACVFNFGNEFCLEDLLPGARKTLLTNVTCVKDEIYFLTLPENLRVKLKSIGLACLFTSILKGSDLKIHGYKLTTNMFSYF